MCVLKTAPEHVENMRIAKGKLQRPCDTGRDQGELSWVPGGDKALRQVKVALRGGQGWGWEWWGADLPVSEKSAEIAGTNPKCL